MESTYTNAQGQVETAKKDVEKVSSEGTISRKAMVGFLSGAAIVFGAAIYYCATTNHMDGVAFLSGAVVLIAIYAASVYKSFK